MTTVKELSQDYMVSRSVVRDSVRKLRVRKRYNQSGIIVFSDNQENKLRKYLAKRYLV